MKSSVQKILLIIAAPLILWGCAAPKLPDLVWPAPPDSPRVKYIKDYRSSQDLQTTSAAAAILLGAERALGLKKPIAVHVDASGKIYVSDTAASDVFIFDPVGQKLDTMNGLIGKQFFFKPIGISTDASGRIFVADSQSDKVTYFDQNGRLLGMLTPNIAFKQPTGIAIDNANNRMYITDTHNHFVDVFDLTTLKQVAQIGKRGKAEGEFNFPSHITVDGKGSVYVTDTMNGRLQIFDKEGRFIRAFGQFGDAIGMFARPKGVAVDSEGHIYVVDAAFNNVQIFDSEGNVLMAFSGYGNDRGQMILPAGIAVDKDDYIYVVDSWNRRVEVFEFLGEKHKLREAQSVKKQ